MIVRALAFSTPRVLDEPGNLCSWPLGERSRSADCRRVGVPLQPNRKLGGPAQVRTVAALDLVRCDAETLPDECTHPLSREQPVVAAQKEVGRDVWPRIERPWFPVRALRR